MIITILANELRNPKYTETRRAIALTGVTFGVCGKSLTTIPNSMRAIIEKNFALNENCMLVLTFNVLKLDHIAWVNLIRTYTHLTVIIIHPILPPLSALRILSNTSN